MAKEQTPNDPSPFDDPWAKALLDMGRQHPDPSYQSPFMVPSAPVQHWQLPPTPPNNWMTNSVAGGPGSGKPSGTPNNSTRDIYNYQSIFDKNPAPPLQMVPKGFKLDKDGNYVRVKESMNNPNSMMAQALLGQTQPPLSGMTHLAGDVVYPNPQQFLPHGYDSPAGDRVMQMQSGQLPAGYRTTNPNTILQLMRGQVPVIPWQGKNG